jgi:antitoxin (DNA-binding transcriptional repressor) of toxin-antitoxin stability system
MQVPMHEFKSNLAKYVSCAQSGQIIELTSHRKVVARVIGVPQTEDAGLARLLAKGNASWQGGKPEGACIRLQEGGKSLSSLVLENRG